MKNASKASIHLRNLREKFWKFMAFKGIRKSFNAEATEECAKFAKFFFEALCFFEDAEINHPVHIPLFQSFQV
jgi:hypothetical protein